ncbi:cobalt-precorrin 5A hydrolase [Romboutsia sedimentorum]|uniref:Cobalt-precorrin 5A hydrolase n=1 Tax=Romboutsia sedimentorum TaxID=1368474 RepID=A0ABT7EDK9_9FIRM|nr:cobalt-precorrin 5A hydrolase [Romboutsia sedimentorum]MDK2565022.1 cobalt-precorrin 5A hydrolase [Romboutsia sedimentorum]MDK2587364.1 cobalt-precorrin 5A hydrolase [Romboutsia sedimentorum]
MNTEAKICLVCITENGKKLALKINNLIENSHVYIVSNKNNNLNIDNEKENVFLVKDKLSVLVENLFKEYQYIIFIMATGIVVRVIAPYINSKFSDPAILVTDEKGSNIISLLSGHMGGANEMTLHISKLINSNPVITTATDVNKKSSLDMIAKKLDAHIDDFRENVKDVNAMLVNNQEVGIYIDGDYDIDTRGFKVLNSIENIDDLEKVVIVTNKKEITKNNSVIKVIPRNLVVGIGCRRNTDSLLLQESLNDLLHQYNIDIKSIKQIGSIDIKHDEKAIIDLASYLGVEFITVCAKDISKVDCLFDKSEFVKKNVGVYCVAEPVTHILSNGNLIIEKHKYRGITISVGRVSK